MLTYFKCHPASHAIIDVVAREEAPVAYNTRESSQANGKPYLVPVTVTDPLYDPATEVKEGPVDSYDGVTATRVYSVRAKTAEELAAEQQASDADLLAQSAKDIALVIAELVDTGLVNPGAFTPAASAALTRIKPPADRLRGL